MTDVFRLRQARLRAMEQGRPLTAIRVTAVDAYQGHLVRRTRILPGGKERRVLLVHPEDWQAILKELGVKGEAGPGKLWGLPVYYELEEAV